jgi:predicted molibdopterin-dependent oxidoreductase YjgC
MAQDEQQQERIERIAQVLEPHFDQTRLRLAQRIAQAEDGRLVEQTEMPIFEELNRLKSKSQEVGLQQRIEAAEAAFSPSGQARPPAQ